MSSNEVSEMNSPSENRVDQDIELLAPAGCWPSLQAAIDAGADSVYFGLSQLNMRARARKSFQLEDLEEIMRRCRAAKIRGFLTLNTLLYDHDLCLAQNLLEEAVRCKVDAVIASDMAAVTKARDLGLEVHISTQLSISNYQSFKFYSQWSDRIVLARELNLRLIRKIFDQIRADDLRGPSGRPMEIEAFAHGAQCIAVAGRCGMSLHTSNASANRGACEQNCRKRYEVKDVETGQKLILDNEFVMSPNDISTIDFLDEFIASGVKVLKIEGRGRAPEYVYTVISAYRAALDAIAAGTYGRGVVDDLLQDLKTVYNRGLSSGYYLGREQGWSGAYGSKATRQKIEVGKISNYFAKPSVALIEATGQGLAVGDEYVVIGETTGVLKGVVEELRVEGEAVTRVPPKTEFTLNVVSTVRRSDRLYFLRPDDA